MYINKTGDLFLSYSFKLKLLTPPVPIFSSSSHSFPLIATFYKLVCAHKKTHSFHTHSFQIHLNPATLVVFVVNLFRNLLLKFSSTVFTTFKLISTVQPYFNVFQANGKVSYMQLWFLFYKPLNSSHSFTILEYKNLQAHITGFRVKYNNPHCTIWFFFLNLLFWFSD